MLRILGSPKRLCEGITRRDLMRVGGLGTIASLGPWGPIALGSDTKPLGESIQLGGFGQAKRCILLCLWGSPSQLDTWDPKPDAPVEIRGDIQSIPTALPAPQIASTRSAWMATVKAKTPRSRRRCPRKWWMPS